MTQKTKKWFGWLKLPMQWIAPVFSMQWGFKDEEGRWVWMPRFSFGPENTTSLYYNGIFYFRVMSLGYRGYPIQFYIAWPILYVVFGLSWWLLLSFCFIGVMVRWSGKVINRFQFLQTHLGWKLNGDFAVTLRIQNDGSAFKSEDGAAFDNYGQALGWRDGTK